MEDLKNTISADDHAKIGKIFDHINYLLEIENYETAVQELLNLHYAELADYLDNTARKNYSLVLPLISDKIHPETLVFLSDSNKQAAIRTLGLEHSAALIEKLDLEDAVAVIEELNDEELKTEILSTLAPDKKQQILEGFNYPENSVGRSLEKDFVALQEHWTTGQAIDYIRRLNLENDFYAAIVVNSKFKPLGTVLLSSLLKVTRSHPLNEIMSDNFKVTEPYTSLNDLAYIFKQYELVVAPVVNKAGKLIGSISIDNMLYIIEESTESDLMNLSGINSSDIYQNLSTTIWQRFPWLFVHLITSCLTSLIITGFSTTILHMIALATITPIVAAVGCNAGTQVMTVTVRALANREINNSNFRKVIFKEIYVSLANGLIIAVISSAISFLFFNNITLSLIFALAIMFSFVIAAIAGTAIPVLLSKMDIDPAMASSVFVAGLADAVGFFSLLGLASIMLM